MIWGMKIEEYRSLSARDRKLVRNRITARIFRAKRKRERAPLVEATFSALALRNRTPLLTSTYQSNSSQSSAPRSSGSDWPKMRRCGSATRSLTVGVVFLPYVCAAAHPISVRRRLSG